MVSSTSFARFEPLAPGRGRFTIKSFQASKELGAYDQGFCLLVVRKGREERLERWNLNAVDNEGFIKIVPVRPMQRGLDFEFEVGPEVNDPMAYDNTGDYLLKIKNQTGLIRSFAISMQGNNIQPSPAAQQTSANTTQSYRFQPNNSGYEPSRAAAATQGAAAASGIGAAPATAPAAAGVGAAAPAAPAGDAGAAAAKSGGGGFMGKLIGLVITLVLLGVAAYFLKGFLGGGEVAPEPPAQEEQKAEESQAAEPEVENTGMVSANKNCQIGSGEISDKDLLNKCLGSKPSADDLKGLLAESLRLNRCEVALRILRTKGREADGAVFAYVYSQYASPNSTWKHSCITKNDSDAAYWSERAKKDQNFKPETGLELLKQLTEVSAQK